MDSHRPSPIQRFFKAVFPKSWGADMEAHSRMWMVRCPCGHAASIWELGGIRCRATGQPRTIRRCPQCGKRRWHKISKDEV